jgi:nucleotide-binding universal stress UspA family protein
MVAITKILCPIDLSDCSRRGLEFALALGRWAEAQVIVLNVGPSVLLFPAVVDRVSPTEVATPTRAERATRVSRFLAPFGDLHRPLDVVLAEGHPARVIADTARTYGVDLIVMGAHQRSFLGRLAFGSTVQELMADSPCPVFVVPDHLTTLPQLPTRNVVSSSSADALDCATSLVRSSVAHPVRRLIGNAFIGAIEAGHACSADLIVCDRRDPWIHELLRQAELPILVVTGTAPCAAEHADPRVRANGG